MNLIIKAGIASLLFFTAYSNEQPATDSPPTSQLDTTKKTSQESFEIDFPVTKFQVEKVFSKDSTAGNILIKNWILRGAENNEPFIYFISQNEVPRQLKAQIEKDSNSIYTAFQTGLTRSAIPLGGTDFTFTKTEYKNYKGMESMFKVFNGE